MFLYLVLTVYISFKHRPSLFKHRPSASVWAYLISMLSVSSRFSREKSHSGDKPTTNWLHLASPSQHGGSPVGPRGIQQHSIGFADGWTARLFVGSTSTGEHLPHILPNNITLPESPHNTVYSFQPSLDYSWQRNN